MAAILQHGEEVEICSRGHRWATAWYPPVPVPAGRMHGACGICLNEAGEIVVISTDGQSWDFPAGRPEGDETWEQTLRREVLEEACAVVREARLLGFSCARRLENDAIGPLLVRSIWLAQVELLNWTPQHEITHRRLVPAADAVAAVLPEFEPFWNRAFLEAGISQRRSS